MKYRQMMCWGTFAFLASTAGLGAQIAHGMNHYNLDSYHQLVSQYLNWMETT